MCGDGDNAAAWLIGWVASRPNSAFSDAILESCAGDRCKPDDGSSDIDDNGEVAR